MRILGNLLVLLLVLAATGCGAARRPAEPHADRAPDFVEPACPNQTMLGFDEDQNPVARSELPADFGTDWVLRCRHESRAIPGEGTVLMLITERSDTPASALMEALRRPSDPATGGACPAILVTPPYFLLVDAAGKAILPALPLDSCGQPRPDGTDPLAAMTFHVLQEKKVRLVESQEAIDTGCAEVAKDMVAIDAERAKPAPARRLWPAPATSLRICRYEATATGEGTFSAGRVLEGDAATNLVAALDLAGPAGTCTAPHSRFAVLSVGDAAYVELDGCHRLLRPDGTLGQLDEATVAALTG